MPGPRLEVAPPKWLQSPYGLLTVVDPRYDEPDQHWRNGVTYQPLCPLVTGAGGALTYDDLCIVTGMPAKQNTASLQVRGATPFSPYSEVDCSPVGGFWADGQPTDSEVRARDALTRSESWQVENAFWTGGNIGGVTNFPHLAANATVFDGAIGSSVLLQSAATTVTGTFDVVEGLGILERLIGNCYNGVGVIHMPVQALPHFASRFEIVERGGTLYTPNGNKIAAGNGYPGTAPDGTAAAAGTSWIYATGPVFAYRGQVESYRKVESFDRSENSLRQIAERTYVLGWDCCHFGLIVSLGGIITGTQAAAT